MAEYINKEFLMREVESRLQLMREEYGDYDHYTDGFEECVDRIECQPIADVVEVRHGEWVGKKYNCDYRWAQPKVKLEDCHYLECSNCGNIHPLYTYDVWTNTLIRCAVFSEPLKIPNYCPNCGAKMRGCEK